MTSRSSEAFAEWDDDRYSTGIERFDEQHKRLFGLLNDLHTAMDEGHSEERVGDILRELERYTEYHFGDEEEFMQDCGYAMDCADCFFDHREMHEQFEEKVRELRERHENGEYVTMDVLVFARDWLDSHIAAADEDQRYGDYYDAEVDDDYEYSPGTLKRDRTTDDAETTADEPAGEAEETDAVEDQSVTLGSEVEDGGPLAVPDESVAAWFADLAATHGDRTAALVPESDGYAERTFDDLYERARAVAGGLLTTDLTPGDRVAVPLPSGYEWSVVDLACQLAGLVSVPLYPSAADDRTCERAERADVDGLVADVDTPVAVQEVAETVVHVDDLPTADPRTLPGLDADPDDPATIVFDVGTPTDRGCVLTGRNLRAAVAALDAEVPLDPGATGTCFLPLAHVYQRVLAYHLWSSGGAVAYAAFEEATTRLGEIDPDVLVGVPKLYQQLYGTLQDRIGDLGWMKRKLAGRAAAYGRGILAGEGTPLKYRAAKRLVFRPLREEFGLDDLTYALSGLERLDDHLIQFFRGIGVPLTELYGPAETAGVATLNRAASFQPGTVGTPVAGTELALSEDGTVLVGGPTVMDGCLDERNAAHPLRDGWYYTGTDGRLVGSRLSLE
ncbi:bacteriohemerythrin [Halorientalis pallida]|uniref:Bacteriohemerythrin n=1 Tax=Halorientalis pallida TaxID=2479928 RepID=A0A498KXN8_9EURY|nr:bacteriohemerythrin [Halorientalis pallida]RXK46453.1 bacteriohemerythrin [Halorientalis pallida]